MMALYTVRVWRGVLILHIALALGLCGISTALSANFSTDTSAEWIAQYLEAELAGQRGDFLTSGRMMYRLARRLNNVELAERAARISAYGKVDSLLFPTTQLWLTLDKSATTAQEAFMETAIVSNKLTEALPLLRDVLAEEAGRAELFLHLAELLALAPDKQKALLWIQALASPYTELVEARFAVAQVATLANQPQIALSEIEHIEKLAPYEPNSALLKGQLLFAQSPQKAIRFYQQFLKKYPDMVAVRMALIRIFVAEKDYTLAKSQFPLLLEYAPDNAEIMISLGAICLQFNDDNSASQYFQAALMLEPLDKDKLYLYLAQIAAKQDDQAAAIAWLRQISNGQYYVDAQVNLANLMAQSRDIDGAIDVLDSLDNLTAQQQIAVTQLKAALLSRVYRYREAFEVLDFAVRQLPNTADLLYEYALVADRLGYFSLAEDALQQVIALKPDFAAAYNSLGYALIEQGIRLDEAQKLIERALILSPNDSYTIDSLGWLYYKKGELQTALRYLRQAYSLSQDPEIAAHLGEVLWQSGSYTSARSIWEEAEKSHPDSKELQQTMQRFIR